MNDYRPAWPPKGIIPPDCDQGWGWYCPATSQPHAGEGSLPDERAALRYLIAHLGGCPAEGARKHLKPARAQLMKLARADAAADRSAPPTGVTEDMIVLWAEVLAGDLALLDDALILVDRVTVTDRPWGDGGTFPAVDVSYQGDGGRRFTSGEHGDRLTAVRRIY